MEEWRKVEGYDSYEVSNTGRVITHNWKGSGITKEMSPSKCRGYLQVNLFDGGKQKCKRIHRLVAEAFIPNPDNLREVNHIDGNKLNNNVSNLEWCTRKENLAHEHRTGLGDAAKEGLVRASIGKRKPVIAIYNKTGEKQEFESIQEAGRKLGVEAQHICSCLKGKRNSTGGYSFQLKEVE